MMNTPTSAIIFLLSFACGLLGVHSVDSDKCTVPNESGCEVVNKVISCIEMEFESDNRILLRIAYVETNFGNTTSPIGGGIWALVKDKFNEMLDYNSVELKEKRMKFEGFCDFTLLSWKDLDDNPLCSGLAARLYILYVQLEFDEAIPNESNIEGQAEFWSVYYNAYGRNELRIKYFVTQVNCLDTCNNFYSGHVMVNHTPVDGTQMMDMSGRDVVDAVISLIESFGCFESDHRMLQRIAYVETEFGTGNCSHRGGGIWALGKSKFDMVRAVKLEDICENIPLQYIINWRNLSWDELQKPLYSGIAARLYLWYLNETKSRDIPLAINKTGQAKYWYSFYHTDSNTEGCEFAETHFITEVNILDKNCSVNCDIFFVLDESTSVGFNDFNNVKQFVYDFVNSFDIGPNDNQVGVITFSDTATVQFHLPTNQNKTATLQAINSLKYHSGVTNTADAICKLLNDGFIEEKGARPTSGTIFRVAIFLTDGKSNRNTTACKQTTTLEAAEELRKQTMLVFAIGVTNNIDDEELLAIASKEEYYKKLPDYALESLLNTNEEMIYEMCNKASAEYNVGSSINGTLYENKNMRYEFPMPDEGISVRICATVGHIVVYGSLYVSNPNSAFYDWKIEVDYADCNYCTSGNCGDIFINKTQSTSQVLLSIGANSTAGSTLYLSVTGLSEENNFTLSSGIGNAYLDDITCDSCDPTDDTPVTVESRDSGNYYGCRYWMLFSFMMLCLHIYF